VVIFSGESGYGRLKVLSILLGFPQTVVFNENGAYFDLSFRSLLRFWWNRFRTGINHSYPCPRILLLQTERGDYIEAALDKLLEEKLFPQARFLVICRSEDASRLRDHPAVEKIVEYERSLSLGKLARLYRELNAFSPDLNCAVFTGRPIFRKQKLAFFLIGARALFALNAQLDGFWIRISNLRNLIRKEPLLFEPDDGVAGGGQVLLVQTEAASVVLEAAKRLRQRRLFPGAHLAIVCRSRDREAFSGLRAEIMTFPPSFSLSSWWGLRRRLRRRVFQARCAVFSGRPVYRAHKIFFWSLGRRKFLFNAQLDGYWASLRTLPRIFRREPLPEHLQGSEAPKIAVIQTEAVPYMQEAIRALRGESLFPGAQVHLVCRKADLVSLPELTGGTHTFGSRFSIREAWALWNQIRRWHPAACIAVFTGRPVFRAAKLLFLLAPARRKFVFNAALDGYWLSLRTLPRLFRREPLRFDLDTERLARPVLFLETERPDRVIEAARITRLPRVAPNARISLFCHAARLPIYQDCGLFEHFTTYSQGRWLGNLATALKLLRSRPETTVAIFSGKSIFLAHKILFWLVPARSRLAFNESLDCFYVHRGNLGLLLEGKNPLSSRFQLLKSLGRPVLKAVLFLPRFAYLLLWLGYHRVKAPSKN
jgi:ADP-heptose:LPS heptosyltransferase